MTEYGALTHESLYVLKKTTISNITLFIIRNGYGSNSANMAKLITKVFATPK